MFSDKVIKIKEKTVNDKKLTKWEQFNIYGHYPHIK